MPVWVTRCTSRCRCSKAHTSRHRSAWCSWFAALADIFDLRFDASTPEALDHLWNRVLAAHRAWEAGRS